VKFWPWPPWPSSYQIYIHFLPDFLKFFPALAIWFTDTSLPFMLQKCCNAVFQWC
jgi:hypothetical protein